ncbi:hypothetical protein BJ085DRAFT_35872 [Dimargaris cristalligena]|uniref:Oligosaccaryltransferase-domain-containing protein n=1 Tax=Dimargaris cristalligena TaxID=215637 RepID=A0A4P9ZR37_9FUNG|nr:hypothetical protein BJ085DRAFT_35872 [Dimargaris cristalligena]|eukprot:RKP35201.1 hypothetical protein BJ085DRAFT_35872 [Dimargaris cristalligena]
MSPPAAVSTTMITDTQLTAAINIASVLVIALIFVYGVMANGDIQPSEEHAKQN